MEGSLMAFKVFTNGSVLQASEVNDNLMRQAVSTFSNAAARTAAITAPSEGMLTYLEDVDRYDHWNGSAWVSPFGMTFLGQTIFTATSAVNIDNVFSSQYDNYVLQINATGFTTSTDFLFRFRTGGVTNTTTNYASTGIWTNPTATTVNVDNRNAVDYGIITQTNNGFGGYLTAEMKIFNPNLALGTTTQTQSMGFFGAIRHMTNGTLFGANTVFDGIRFEISGTMSGRIRIYGMRRA
jgi:hypothetical protein